MEFIRIKSKDDYYWKDLMKIYRKSFPLYEQINAMNQLEVLKDENYYCTAICENKNLIGLLFYWNIDKYIYIEHLAISPKLRGKSYGSKIIKEFCKKDATIILEIDTPCEDISIKRLRFYSKLGFVIQDFSHLPPSYRNGFRSQRLKIMCFNKNLTDDEYDEFYSLLNENILIYSESNSTGIGVEHNSPYKNIFIKKEPKKNTISKIIRI